MANYLTQDDEKEALAKVFEEIDLDGSGTLSKEELFLCYERHFGAPITKEEVDVLFERVDRDGSGEIGFSEFVMATTDK